MANKKRVYSKQELFAKNIVEQIKAKKITFGKVAKVSGPKSGEKYTSKKNKDTGAYLTVEKVTKKGSKQARSIITLITTNGDLIRTDVITGEFARKAFDAITFVPTAKKNPLSETEISDLNAAFGF